MENTVPIDSHGLLALIAPRPLGSQTAFTDPCDPSFAVERAYMAGKTVYNFLNASDNIKLIWRFGEHHGMDNIQLYFDFFDAAFNRGGLTLSEDFPEKLIHTFDWEKWNASHAFIPPPPLNFPPPMRVQYGLGNTPLALGLDPGGCYGEQSEDFIPVRWEC